MKSHVPAARGGVVVDSLVDEPSYPRAAGARISLVDVDGDVGCDDARPDSGGPTAGAAVVGVVVLGPAPSRAGVSCGDAGPVVEGVVVGAVVVGAVVVGAVVVGGREDDGPAVSGEAGVDDVAEDCGPDDRDALDGTDEEALSDGDNLLGARLFVVVPAGEQTDSPRTGMIVRVSGGDETKLSPTSECSDAVTVSRAIAAGGVTVIVPDACAGTTCRTAVVSRAPV